MHPATKAAAAQDQGLRRPRTLTIAPLVLMPLLIVSVVRQAARPLSDPDAFWHLRLGDLLRDDLPLPSVPDWQTEDRRSWVLTQWLPEVVTAQFESWFGLPGVMWLYGLSLVILTLLVYRLVRSEAGLLAGGFATALALVAMGPSLSARPHMLTYIFLAVSVGAWLTSVRTGRGPWILIPLTWVWAMCHGMWFLGPLVGMAVIAGMSLDRSVERGQRHRLLAVPALSVVAAALTPVGPALLSAPFAVGEVGQFITEWQPPSFRELGPAAAAVMVGSVAATWARSERRVSWISIMLLVLAAGWIVLADRTVTVGAIIAAPLVAASIQTWLDQVPEPATRREWLPIIGTSAVALIVLGLVLPQIAEDPHGFPAHLNPELRQLAANTEVINSYETGGWLRWEHPQLDPLIDGLTEAYTVGELSDYARLNAVAEGWEEQVAETDATVALLPAASPLALALQDRLGWTATGEDEGYVLLRAS